MASRIPFETEALEEAFDPHRVPLAWRNMFADPVRLARAAAGIGFAVFLMLMQLGFKHAFLESAVQFVRALDGEVFLVSATKYSMGQTDNFPRRRLYQALEDPDVIWSRPIYTERNLSIWKNPESKESFVIQVLAFDPDKPVIAIPEIMSHLDVLKQPDTILIDSRARRFLGSDFAVDAGETELARRRIRIAGTFPMGPDFTTDGTAIMGDRNFAKFFPERAGGARPTRAEIGVLKLDPEADPEIVATRLGARLADDVQVLTKEGLVALEEAFQLEVSNVGPIFLMGTVIGFVVGMLISYQILFTDLSDQLPQFATLKAMGYKNSYLVAVVMQQAVFYGLVGFVPAVILALFAFSVVGEIALLPMELTLDIAAGSGALTVGMCMAAGAVAVRRVLAADPAEVF